MDRIERLRQTVIDAVAPLDAERLAVGAAAGRWLAAPALAEVAAPPVTCSAMDGWAVRSGGAAGEALAVAMTVYAGQAPPRPLAAGEAARVFTGAALPEGADAVVREELAQEEGGQVRFREAPRPLENVRRAGEDVPRGGVALPAGERLGARQLGLCAAVGVREVEVVRRPRVALLATGDEVVGGGTPDSNGAALAAALSAAGMEVRRLAVGDDLGAVAEVMGDALAAADAVVTIGGVSVGARDHVPAAAARLGGEVRIHGVPMKPGKPFLFALVRGRPLFGLPGSPSACLVAFEVFARPALLRLAGAARPLRRRAFLPLAERVEGRPGRARFLWARLEDDGRVRPLGRDAAQVRGPALASALLYLAEGAGALEEGGAVEAWLLEDDVP